MSWRENLRTVGLLALALAIASPAAWAHSKRPIVINAGTLRRLLLNHNASVLAGLTGVYQAKEQVNLARANLLPSLSLTAALSAATGFGLTGVSALVPFLFPSNWANVGVSENQYAADGAAFYITELNTYASAMGLYLTILADQETAGTLEQQADISRQIEAVTRTQNQLGSATAGEVALAASQTATAQAAALKAQELVASEVSSFRTLLALPERPLQFQKLEFAPLPQENWSIAKLLRVTFYRSPEVRQVRYLIEAAKAGTWSATFNFLNAYTISSPTSDNGFVTLANLGSSTHEWDGGIGFSYGPTIRLTNLNTEAMYLQLRELRHDEMGAIETVLASLKSSEQQVTLAKRAEIEGLTAFKEQMGLYKQGQITIQAVKLAAINILSLAAARIASESDLANQRLTLRRIILGGEFAKISKCDIKPNESQIGGPLGALIDLMNANSAKISVDQLCQGRGRDRRPIHGASL